MITWLELRSDAIAIVSLALSVASIVICWVALRSIARQTRAPRHHSIRNAKPGDFVILEPGERLIEPPPGGWVR